MTFSGMHLTAHDAPLLGINIATDCFLNQPFRMRVQQ